MADINAKSGGVIDKALDTIKSIFDKFFDLMSKLDDNPKLKLSNGKFKKTGPQSGVFTSMYDNKVPVAVDIKVHDDGETADYKFYINDTDGMKHPAEYKNLPVMYRDDPEFIELTTEAMDKIITKDVKKAFGLRFSKTINVRLHKVTGSKEDSVMLTGIKANFNISEANAIFADILDNDEFIEQLPEEPTDFEIVDIGDEYEVSSCGDFTGDYLCDALKNILCAALTFNMTMQLWHWKSWQCEKIFRITQDLMYTAQQCVDTYGMWLIEFYKDCGDIDFNTICQSAFTPDTSIDLVAGEAVRQAVLNFNDVLNFQYPNFPHDIQNQLDYTIRRLAEVANLELDMY